MTSTITKLSHADTLKQYGLVSCDFSYNPEVGVEFSVFASGSEPNVVTTVTPLFDYNNDEQVQAIKDICLAIVDNAFPDIHNITEVGGCFYVEDSKIVFEGDVTTVLTGMYRTI